MWFKRYLLAGRLMSVEEALRTLEINPEDVKGKSADEVSKIVRKYRNRLAIKIHPDRATSPEQKKEFHVKMVNVNNAFDALEARGFDVNTGGSSGGYDDSGDDYWYEQRYRAWADEQRRQQGHSRPGGGQRKRSRPQPPPSSGPRPGEGVETPNVENINVGKPPPRSTKPPPKTPGQSQEARQQDWKNREKAARASGKVPPWAVEWDAKNFDVGDDRSDYFYCQKEIYEQAAKEGGQVEPFTIWEFVEAQDPLSGGDGWFTNRIRVFSSWPLIFDAVRVAEDYFNANSQHRTSTKLTPSILFEQTDYNTVNPQRDDLYLVKVGTQPVNMEFTVKSGEGSKMAAEISQAVHKIKQETGQTPPPKGK